MGKNLETAIKNIRNKFGKESVVAMIGEVDHSIKKCSTGSLTLDIALGGGNPYGRIIEIFGPESSGKTTVVLESMKQAQDANPDKAVAYIDMEFSFDPIYAENLGLDLTPERFIFSQPSSGEEAFGIVEELLKSNEVSFIGVDSVAALTPQAEIDGEMGESKMGLHARLMSQGMRKVTGLVSKCECILYFTNQLRDKIGVMYGNPETTTGGNALKFYTSIRLDIRKKVTDKDTDGLAYANQVKIKVVKNKVAPPFRECDLTIEYGIGFSKESEILNLAVEKEVIKKSGSWFSYGEQRLGQGRENVIEVFKNSPEVMKEIETKVKQMYNIN